MPTRKFTVGTRGSLLALTQTNWLIDQLKGQFPTFVFESRIFTTRGDQIQDRPLQAITEDGFFVRELENALLAGEIDLAIHSLKDLPSTQPAGLAITATPIRADARDALVSRYSLDLEHLPIGAMIGTSSVRRVSQLLAFRPDFQTAPIRGNVDTRLRKLHNPDSQPQYTALVLAAAGLDRLNRAETITNRLPLEFMLPAPGQGALAPECRADDTEVVEMLATINHPETFTAITCEKAFMSALGGGCQTPVGCYAQVIAGEMVVAGYVGSPDGAQSLRVSLTESWQNSIEQAQILGATLAQQALAQGAAAILSAARQAGYITPRA